MVRSLDVHFAVKVVSHLPLCGVGGIYHLHFTDINTKMGTTKSIAQHILAKACSAGLWDSRVGAVFLYPTDRHPQRHTGKPGDGISVSCCCGDFSVVFPWET